MRSPTHVASPGTPTPACLCRDRRAVRSGSVLCAPAWPVRLARLHDPGGAGDHSFGYCVTTLGSLVDSPWLHGLKIAAMAIVVELFEECHGGLRPDRERATIAVGATMVVRTNPLAPGQI